MELEIWRPGLFGDNASATLVLPTTPYELADALDSVQPTNYGYVRNNDTPFRHEYMKPGLSQQMGQS
jgi:hypothetical protein